MKITLLFIIFTIQINIAQNTFPLNGNVGVGIINPEANLDVVGNGRFSTGILTSAENSFEKVFSSAVDFENTIANSAVDIRLGNLSFWGYIEIEITGTWSHQSTGGKLTKIYAVGTNPNNNIYINESRVSDAMGTIPDNISLGNFSWDSANDCFKIPISHTVSTHNNYTIKIKMFTHGGGAKAVYSNMSIGPNYSLPALPRNYVYFNNKLGVGTANPDELLTVKGKIHAEEIRIDLSVPVPDYVFANDYKLKTLDEVAAYIQKNKHLPEVPSAQEIKKEGLMLAEMNMILLKKMEEMTLYMIEMKKENDEIKKSITELKQHIKIN